MRPNVAMLMPAPSDGRALTAYLSAGQQDEYMRRKYGLRDENEYRRFLQANAPKVANDMRLIQTELPPTFPTRQ